MQPPMDEPPIAVCLLMEALYAKRSWRKINDYKNVITIKGMNKEKKNGIAREMLSYVEFLL
jgi:hypothetical protein